MSWITMPYRGPVSVQNKNFTLQRIRFMTTNKLPYPSCSWVRRTSKHGSSICIWKQLQFSHIKYDQKDKHWVALKQEKKKETTEGYVKSESSNPIMSNVLVVFVILEQQTNNRQCQQHTSKRSMIVNSSTVAGPDWIINKDLCEWMGKNQLNKMIRSVVECRRRPVKNKRTNETKF